MASKVAVVTGGNKGIGYAIVKGLCQQLQGYDVLLTARDEDRGKAAVEQLNKEFGVSPKFFPLDITDKATIERLKHHLVDTYGGLDVLVNNAGMAYKGSSTAPFSEQAEVTMTTNFTGTLDVCDALFPILRSHARVVHLSSRVSTMSLGKCSNEKRQKFTSMKTIDELKSELDSFVKAAKEGKHEAAGYPTQAYGMSKIGVTVMTPIQQASFEAERGGDDILVNSCCPGYVSTDMSSHKGHLSIDQGADTAMYLATLPPGATSPKGDFVAERVVLHWREMTGWRLYLHGFGYVFRVTKNSLFAYFR